MTTLRAFLLRLVGAFRDSSAADAAAREEMQAHLAMDVRENMRRGMSAEAARREALARAGGITQAAELVRERRGLPWMQEVGTDLRLAARALRHHPGFTAVAVITLALGVGANTAIFSVVNGVVLQPLAYPDADRLVTLASTMGERSMEVSGPDFIDWREQARSFSGIAAAYTSETVLTGSGEPERLQQARVTANTLGVLALNPRFGRGFAEGEDEPSAARVAMLGEDFWQRRFGGDSSVVGKTMTFDGYPTTIIGIAPREMRWPQAADVWMTTRFTDRDLSPGARGARWITVLGRIAPDATLPAARRELGAIAARLEQLDPKHNEGVGARVTPFLESIVGELETPLFVLLGAVGFVLLIACANVASLTLGRVASRDAELAVRTALGATRGRIARQIMTESLLLAMLGGALGVGLALVGMRALLAIAPADLPRVHDVSLDASVLAFTLALTVLAGVLFGVVPAMQGAATGLHDRLRSAGRGTKGSRSSGRSRRMLVVTEVALAVVLLAGAGLLLRSFARLRSVDPGFQATSVTTFSVSLPSTRYAGAESQRQFSRDLLDGLRQVPGVASAGTSFALPLSGVGFGFTFEIAGRTVGTGPNEPRAQARVASTAYFATMGIPVVRGRVFDERDQPGALPALVISSELARRYFPDRDPIGQRLLTGWTRDSVRFGGAVVGVVGDVRQFALDGGVTAHMYMSDAQWPLNEYDVVVRTTVPGDGLTSAMRAVLHRLDPDVPMGGVRPLGSLVDASLGSRRFYMQLLGGFAAVAMALAIVGIYGVIAYGVRLRRQEIGVRLALGATRRGILTMVLSDGLRLVCIGVGIGVVAATLLTRFLSTLLFEVGRFDPVSFGVASLALVVAAALACVVPARGAAALDPVEIIRRE
ncbi:MAG: ABC transporter permease [Cytophagaceae bacterium]|nr:ABC transporter permease [Gemmatimonadaceae bacterium]